MQGEKQHTKSIIMLFVSVVYCTFLTLSHLFEPDLEKEEEGSG
jgi:hypothetical protein